MKKVFCLLAVLVSVFALIFTGCSNSTNEQGEEYDFSIDAKGLSSAIMSSVKHSSSYSADIEFDFDDVYFDLDYDVSLKNDLIYFETKGKIDDTSIDSYGYNDYENNYSYLNTVKSDDDWNKTTLDDSTKANYESFLKFKFSDVVERIEYPVITITDFEDIECYKLNGDVDKSFIYDMFDVGIFEIMEEKGVKDEFDEALADEMEDADYLTFTLFVDKSTSIPLYFEINSVEDESEYDETGIEDRKEFAELLISGEFDDWDGAKVKLPESLISSDEVVADVSSDADLAILEEAETVTGEIVEADVADEEALAEDLTYFVAKMAKKKLQELDSVEMQLKIKATQDYAGEMINTESTSTYISDFANNDYYAVANMSGVAMDLYLISDESGTYDLYIESSGLSFKQTGISNETAQANKLTGTLDLYYVYFDRLVNYGELRETSSSYILSGNIDVDEEILSASGLANNFSALLQTATDSQIDRILSALSTMYIEITIDKETYNVDKISIDMTEALNSLINSMIDVLSPGEKIDISVTENSNVVILKNHNAAVVPEVPESLLSATETTIFPEV